MTEPRKMEDAPRNGTSIIAYWYNGCCWEADVVWWYDTGDGYPWYARNNAYPEDKFDEWREIEWPEDWKDVSGQDEAEEPVDWFSMEVGGYKRLSPDPRPLIREDPTPTLGYISTAEVISKSFPKTMTALAADD